ncbi:hypothetical protein BB561_001128 [Smittium simulii]|uniref:Phosphatidic acid phosphatase type 2/haloperoxidase domain-containing protein n=1 Tax=Smittium simulii TaxID=133385 RepID=A0A2T9YW08_9FUNG|nr:hypothetical protein BB561_001128 [Smittium simulii]
MHKKDTVPMWAAVIISYILPVIIIVLFTLLKKNKSYIALQAGIFSLTLSQFITLLFTEALKNLVGRHRPDFISRCKPSMSLINQTKGVSNSGNPAQLFDPIFGFFTTEICSAEKNKELYDGMRSFPSGHSSTAFCGLFFLSLFLAANLSLYDRKCHAYKAIVVIIPLVIAAVIAASRVSDYRHHWQDVTAGSILGAIVAYYIYYIYYPKVKSENSYLPYQYIIDDSTTYELGNLDQQSKPSSNRGADMV